MSDIAASSRIDDAEVFGAAFSRLANINGMMLIELGVAIFHEVYFCTLGF